MNTKSNINYIAHIRFNEFSLAWKIVFSVLLHTYRPYGETPERPHTMQFPNILAQCYDCRVASALAKKCGILSVFVPSAQI